VLLARDADGAEPASAALRALAAAKLPEVDALIARATAMRTWLDAARACRCATLDACALFAGGRAAAAG
jgi:MerR family transcriptional regulator, redox-sensitive transcriptional activator SoxR